MNILFTICGRAGSKGIRNKNIRDFLGYPLPYYTFSAAALYINNQQKDKIDVVLNTDSEELMQLTKNNPFLSIDIVKRKEELAGDRVPKPAVILDSLQQCEACYYKKYDMVVDLDITSPLRTVEDIRNLIETQALGERDVTFSVTDSRRNPYFNMVMETEDGIRKVLASEYVARQQAPDIYDMNASLYAYSPEFLRRGLGVLDGKCAVIKMMDTGILDLDHENDFELMEVIAGYLFENRKEFGEIYIFLKKKYN